MRVCVCVYLCVTRVLYFYVTTNRAQMFERSYRQVANEKVDVVNMLRDCRRKLSRVKDKLDAYDLREDNLRDLRRQASKFAERADEAQARLDAMKKEVDKIKKEKDRAILRAQQGERSYRQVATLKVAVVQQLQDCRKTLSRMKGKVAHVDVL